MQSSSLEGVKEYPDRVIGKAEKTYPGSCAVAQAFTQPTHIIKIPKTEKLLIFEYDERTVAF